MIIYMSTHGCTESVSVKLAEKLNGEVILHNLKNDKKPDFSSFDRVIIGGSIHLGQIQRKLKTFCTENLEKLGRKEVGLFICCMEEGETAYKQLNEAFPEKLHQYSKAEAILGCEFNLERMSFLEKMIIKKVAKLEESVSKIDHEGIEKFAKRMDKTFSPFLMLV